MIFAGETDLPTSSFNEIIQNLRTPQQLVHFLKEEFKYVEDQKLFGKYEYWQSPSEFLARRAGDCEDFALFAQYVLLQLGFEAQVVNLYSQEGYAHTVTIFRKDGKYHAINQNRLLDLNAVSLEKALDQIYPYWNWASVAMRKEGFGWPVQEIHNPTPVAPPFADPFSEQLF